MGLCARPLSWLRVCVRACVWICKCACVQGSESQADDSVTSSADCQLPQLQSHQHSWCSFTHVRPIYCNVCRETLSSVTRSPRSLNALSCEGLSILWNENWRKMLSKHVGGSGVARGRHLLGAANGRKLYFKNSRKNFRLWVFACNKNYVQT